MKKNGTIKKIGEYDSVHEILVLMLDMLAFMC